MMMAIPIQCDIQDSMVVFVMDRSPAFVRLFSGLPNTRNAFYNEGDE